MLNLPFDSENSANSSDSEPFFSAVSADGSAGDAAAIHYGSAAAVVAAKQLQEASFEIQEKSPYIFQMAAVAAALLPIEPF